MYNNLIVENETELNYILEKDITNLYDLNQTKENVIDIIRHYKIALAKSINVIDGITSSLTDTDKIKKSLIDLNANFTRNIEKKIEAEAYVNTIKPTIDSLKQTFTKIERNYFEMCLMSNYSESYFIDNCINGLSRNGFFPIKNSCILKTAFAFGVEVSRY